MGIEPYDWTRARTDLELAILLAEHLLEITQPGCGEAILAYSEGAQEAIAEVLRRRDGLRPTCVSKWPQPSTMLLGDTRCEEGR